MLTHIHFFAPDVTLCGRTITATTPLADIDKATCRECGDRHIELADNDRLTAVHPFVFIYGRVDGGENIGRVFENICVADALARFDAWVRDEAGFDADIREQPIEADTLEVYHEVVMTSRTKPHFTYGY